MTKQNTNGIICMILGAAGLAICGCSVEAKLASKANVPTPTPTTVSSRFFQVEDNEIEGITAENGKIHILVFEDRRTHDRIDCAHTSVNENILSCWKETRNESQQTPH